MKQEYPLASMILRIGIFGLFFGHGYLALHVNQSWIPLVTTFGFSIDFATFIMPYIGLLDIIVAISVLINPHRSVLIWAVFWAFMTALSRPLAGYPIWDFVERSANWTSPLALLFIHNFSKIRFPFSKK